MESIRAVGWLSWWLVIMIDGLGLLVDYWCLNGKSYRPRQNPRSRRRLLSHATHAEPFSCSHAAKLELLAPLTFTSLALVSAIENEKILGLPTMKDMDMRFFCTKCCKTEIFGKLSCYLGTMWNWPVDHATAITLICLGPFTCVRHCHEAADRKKNKKQSWWSLVRHGERRFNSWLMMAKSCGSIMNDG